MYQFKARLAKQKLIQVLTPKNPLSDKPWEVVICQFQVYQSQLVLNCYIFDLKQVNVCTGVAQH